MEFYNLAFSVTVDKILQEDPIFDLLSYDRDEIALTGTITLTYLLFIYVSEYRMKYNDIHYNNFTRALQLFLEWDQLPPSDPFAGEQVRPSSACLCLVSSIALAYPLVQVCWLIQTLGLIL